MLLFYDPPASLDRRLHQDPTLWESPETFDPRRFLRKTEHGQRRHIYQFMPVRFHGFTGCPCFDSITGTHFLFDI
jgi:cytochrome P450